MSKEYYESESVSQTRLKKICNHPMSYKLYNPFGESSALTLGSLVDCILLTPNELEERFIELEDNSIPTAIKSIWDEFYEHCEVLGNFDYQGVIEEELLHNIIEAQGYRLKNKRATRLKFVIDNAQYFENKVKARGKTVIDSETLAKAHEICESIMNHPFTSHVIPSATETQVAIYWRFKDYDIELKSLLDFIEIDEENKTIQPWDLKTTAGYTSKFHEAIYKFRYDFQAAFYTAALMFAYPDYTILPFKILVESTTRIGAPMIYTLSDEALKVGAFGGEIDGVYYEGWMNCLDTLAWHLKENVWDYPKFEYEQKGQVTI